MKTKEGHLLISDFGFLVSGFGRELFMTANVLKRGSQVYVAGEFSWVELLFGLWWNVLLYENCLQENNILGTITCGCYFLFSSSLSV